ncbi:MAG: hypothetical protein V1811_03295 [Candidatus Micrarchaeota archaeon]
MPREVKANRIFFLIHPMFAESRGDRAPERLDALYETYASRIESIARLKRKPLLVIVRQPEVLGVRQYQKDLENLATELLGPSRVFVTMEGELPSEAKEKLKPRAQLTFLGEYRNRCVTQAMYDLSYQLGLTPQAFAKRVRIDYAHTSAKYQLPIRTLLQLDKKRRREYFKTEQKTRPAETDIHRITYAMYQRMRAEHGHDHFTALNLANAAAKKQIQELYKKYGALQ